MSPKRSKRTKQTKVPEKKTEESAVRKKKPVQSFKMYLYLLLKGVNPALGISRNAMEAMNNFMFDMFERIATEAARLLTHRKKPTLAPIDMQSAVKLLLPGELSRHAVSEGTKAVKRYNQSK